MTYVLHYAPDNASLIIRLALEHRGIAYRTRLVNRAATEQASPAYLKLNPHGLIPVLETQEGPIFETGAILLWLADRHGGLAPAPEDPDRAGFLKWFFFAANTLHPTLRLMFYPEKVIAKAHRDALRDGLQEAFCDHLTEVERAAATRPAWLFGDTPGILDFYLCGLLRWPALYPAGRDCSWYRLDTWPSLAAMCRRVEALPCTTALQKTEGLGDTPFTRPSHPNPPEGSAT